MKSVLIELLINSLKSVVNPAKTFRELPEKPAYNFFAMALLIFIFGIVHEITRNVMLEPSFWLAEENRHLLLLTPIYVGGGLVLMWIIYSSTFFFLSSKNRSASIEKIRLGTFYFCSTFMWANVFDLPHFFGFPYLTKTLTYAWDIHLATVAIVVLSTRQLWFFSKQIVNSAKGFYLVFTITWLIAFIASGLADFIRPWPIQAFLVTFVGIDVEMRLLRFYYLVLMLIPLAAASHFSFVKKNYSLSLSFFILMIVLFFLGYVYNPLGSRDLFDVGF